LGDLIEDKGCGAQQPTSSKIYAQPEVADDFEPDLLVLGFEELDLSAGALVAGAGTSREEAWTVAIIASLGEKGSLYEKVQLIPTLSYSFVLISL
jgi:hypothetical protein